VSDIPGPLQAALSDRYRLERELGAGGMATVYLAEDLKHHRKVAVKVLRPDLAASLGSERFLREIEVAANLTHPHILPLHDSGAVAGFLYYVMPYIDGESLRARLNRVGELPVPEAVRILREVVDALACAHAQGVVHRDIKPDNVMLSGRHALVMDFGVAKAVSEATGRQTITTLGVAIGTPAYMAPEQVAADPHIDHRADIYAVGVLAYELLVGRPPFAGATPQQVLAAHVTTAPEPVDVHRPAVPASLAQLVMRCLEKKPADRPQTAEELLPVLDVLTTTSGSTTPVAVPTPKRRQVVPIAGLLLATLAGVWVVANRTATNAASSGRDATRSIAVLPFQNQGGGAENQAFTDGVQDDILTQLSKIGALQVTSRTSVQEYRNRTKSVKEIARELGVGAILDGGVQRSGNQVHVNVQLIDAGRDRHLWAESYDRALTAENIFAIQGDIAREVAGALRARLTPDEAARIAEAPTTNLEALDYYHRGNILVGQRGDPKSDSAAVRAFEGAVRADSTFGEAWAGLAIARSWLVRTGETRTATATREALHRAEALAPGKAETELAAGFYHYYAAGSYAEALRHFRAAERQRPSDATAIEGIGLILRRQGKWVESLSYLERATTLAPRDPGRLLTIAQSLFPLRRFDEAEQVLRRAMILSPDFEPAAAFLVITLAWGRGDTAAAWRLMESQAQPAPTPLSHLTRSLRARYRRDYRTAIAEQRAVLGSGARAFGNPLATLAELAYLSGDSVLVRVYADSLVHDAERTRRRIQSGEQVDVFGALEKAHEDIGLASALRGEPERAEREGRLGVIPLSRDAVEAFLPAQQLATIYVLTGNHAAAVAELRQLLAVPSFTTVRRLRLDPIFDPLRRDPAFQALLKE
jgi:serine/threonine protein kinase/tetratricopeptide (TPR) repeat protein